MIEIETEAEKKAGMKVSPDLAWHEAGCVKRYGAQSDQPCECEKRAEAAQRRSAEGQ